MEPQLKALRGRAAGEITREERLDLELALGMAAVRDGAYRRELLEVRSGVAALDDPGCPRAAELGVEVARLGHLFALHP